MGGWQAQIYCYVIALRDTDTFAILPSCHPAIHASMSIKTFYFLFLSCGSTGTLSNIRITKSTFSYRCSRIPYRERFYSMTISSLMSPFADRSLPATASPSPESSSHFLLVNPPSSFLLQQRLETCKVCFRISRLAVLD